MTVRGVRAARLLLLGAGLALASGCTLFDEDPVGASFGLRQPEARVTLQGEIQADLITEAGTDCAPGGTVFWGTVRNDGDVNVSDVSIVIIAFDARGGLLGSFTGSVYSGEVIESPDGLTQFGTNLDVDQAGTFNVCTGVPFGAAARAEYETRFVVIDESGSL